MFFCFFHQLLAIFSKTKGSWNFWFFDVDGFDKLKSQKFDKSVVEEQEYG